MHLCKIFATLLKQSSKEDPYTEKSSMKTSMHSSKRSDAYHTPLKGSKCIGQTERHPSIFISPKGACASSLLLILRCKVNLKIT